MLYADLGIGDTGAPVVNSVSVPTEWSSTAAPTITVNATDTGIGVQKVTLKRVATGTTAIDYFTGCAGTRSSSCPRQRTATATTTYGYTSLPEGSHTFEAKAHDPLNVSTAKTVTLKIDRTAPTLAATGTLVNTSNPLIGAYPTVTVDADDARSGIEKVLLKIDGNTVDQVTQACPGGACSLEEDIQFDLSGISSGSHTFQLVAVDFAGNTDAISGTMVLDSIAPTLSGTGDLIDYDGQPLPMSSATASLSGSDSGTGNTGIARFETTVNDGTPIVDNKTCAPNCPASATSSFNYVKSAWPTGGNMIEFAAVDKAGNRRYLTIWVDVPEEQPVDLMCDSTTPTVLASGDELSVEDAVDSIEDGFTEAVEPSDSVYDEAASEAWQPTLVPPAIGTTPPDVDMEMIQTFAEGEAGALPASGFTIGHQTCMTPAQTTADETEGEIVNGDSVLYANSATDSDTVVRPTPLGAVVVQHLRGDDAPTSFAWDVSLEDGQELVELNTGGIAVVVSDSEVPSDPNEVRVEPDRDSIADLSDSQTQFEGSLWDIEMAREETGKEVVSVLSPPIARTVANAWVAVELQKIAAAKVALALASQPAPGADIALAFASATPRGPGSGGISPGPTYPDLYPSPYKRFCEKKDACLYVGATFNGSTYTVKHRDVTYDLVPIVNKPIRSAANATGNAGFYMGKTTSIPTKPGFCLWPGQSAHRFPEYRPNLYTNIKFATLIKNNPHC